MSCMYVTLLKAESETTRSSIMSGDQQWCGHLWTLSTGRPRAAGVSHFLFLLLWVCGYVRINLLRGHTHTHKIQTQYTCTFKHNTHAHSNTIHMHIQTQYTCTFKHNTHAHAHTLTLIHTLTFKRTSQQTVGVIVRLEKEAFKVLTQYGKEVNVPQHAIQPRKTRAVALDCRQVRAFKSCYV